MTNFDLWKVERIKEIEEMDIDEVIEKTYYEDLNCTDCCVNGLKKGIDGQWCKIPPNKRTERNCRAGIKAYLEQEVQDE